MSNKINNNNGNIRFRILTSKDKAALEQLISTIENSLAVPEWWIPIDCTSTFFRFRLDLLSWRILR